MSRPAEPRALDDGAKLDELRRQFKGVTFADAAASFNPDALPDGVQLSDTAARIVALFMAERIRAANGPQEQADAVAELERLAPKLEPNVVRWRLDRRRSRRMRLATIVHRLLGRPQARARGRRRRAMLRRSPSRSPARREPEPEPPPSPREAAE